MSETPRREYFQEEMVINVKGLSKVQGMGWGRTFLPLATGIRVETIFYKVAGHLGDYKAEAVKVVDLSTLSRKQKQEAHRK